ncbi:hypothetical protein GE061_004153 [Apolygus lucorum]|uniref:Cytochrome P450 n=1 Tax=Apolygus lucorum TaxID=248454 RepID=A0A8S9X060_APOLU|nr:hypothetical protein GE061_004153 [Apolygus lucorum]
MDPVLSSVARRCTRIDLCTSTFIVVRMIPWIVVIPCALGYLLYWVIKTLGTIPSWRTIRLFNKLQGPTDQPFFVGASWELRNVKPEDRISYFKDKYDEFGGWYACYSMGQPWLLVSDPEIIKVLLTDNINIHKGPEYSMLEKLVHQGLLISSGRLYDLIR